MTDRQHPFCWYELTTPDATAAARFYGDVFGWTARDAGNPAMPYTLLASGGRDIGGIYQFPDDPSCAGMKPGWLGYIAGDVETDVPRVQAAGGTVHKACTDIPGVGRFAIVGDPHGAAFVIFTPDPMPGDMPEPVPATTPGHVGWHELHAGNGLEAWEFYSGLFGWTGRDGLDMGPAGVYRIFAIDGVDRGGVMTKMPEMPAPSWLYYVTVAGIDAAIARVRAAGGTIINGPHQVPDGPWIAQGADPLGGMFAMMSEAR